MDSFGFKEKPKKAEDAFLEQEIERLLEDENAYSFFSTPLKSAKTCRMEHKQQIQEVLSMKEWQTAMADALDLIRQKLSAAVGVEAAQQVQKELRHAPEHLSEKLKDPALKSSSLQHLMGLSDDSLVSIYELAYDLLLKQDYKESLALLKLLSFLAPQIPSYWIAQGFCLHHLQKVEEAAEAYEIAKILNPEDPQAYIALANCYLHLKEKRQAQDALDQAEQLLLSQPNDQWMQEIDSLKPLIKSVI
jgi:tetratricopeptide (TPR) repeat protein